MTKTILLKFRNYLLVEDQVDVARMIEVVMAIIVRDDGKVLIAKRDSFKQFGGLWEFPGGKREMGEPLELTLAREIREELGVEIDMVGTLDSYYFESKDLNACFYPFLVQITNGVVRKLEHEDLAYVDLNELANYDLAPPDHQAVDLLAKEFEQFENPAIRTV